MIMNPETGYRVLLVEDHRNLRQLARLAMESSGHAVVDTENGRTALDCIAEQPFDLIVTDWRMPEMDGHEMITRLRQRPEHAEIPVLVLSCLTAPALETLQALGIRRWLRKPCSISFLQQAVDQALTLGTLAASNQ